MSKLTLETNLNKNEKKQTYDKTAPKCKNICILDVWWKQTREF